MCNTNVIAVFGLGHIGLPTATLFAKNDYNVLGVDINREIVEKINYGISPIMEPDLDGMVNEVTTSGNLKATLDGVQSAKKASVMIVVVPTPVDQKKCANLSAVISACENISQGLNKGDLVIIESTVPPGTCENIVIPILEKSGLKSSQDFDVAYTPERALPNNTLYEMTHNARVIGGINEKSADKAANLYHQITVGEIIIVKNLVTAEMVKLMENTYRDTNIALANELTMVCESMDVDAIDAIKAANFHPRVDIHTPGPGVGGHCLSIDPYFIVEIGEQKGTPARLIKTAREINEHMPYHVAGLVEEEMVKIGKSVSGSKIAILGVAYKGNVADTRESPSITLITSLIDKGAEVVVHDPHVSKDTIISMGAQPSGIQDALCCDCVVLMTDHDLYEEISPEMVRSSLFICTRPILNPEDFKDNGIIFRGMGRF
jgi:nucleotide sugar dehydrogenase